MKIGTHFFGILMIKGVFSKNRGREKCRQELSNNPILSLLKETFLKNKVSQFEYRDNFDKIPCSTDSLMSLTKDILLFHIEKIVKC